MNSYYLYHIWFKIIVINKFKISTYEILLQKVWEELTKKKKKKIANIRNKIFHFVIFFTVTSIICLFILKQFGYFQIWSHVAVTTNPKWKSRTSNGAYNEKPRGRFRSHTVDIERRMPIGSLSTLESSSFYSSFAATPLSLSLPSSPK